jgi:hypothetical protein
MLLTGFSWREFGCVFLTMKPRILSGVLCFLPFSAKVSVPAAKASGVTMVRGTLLSAFTKPPFFELDHRLLIGGLLSLYHPIVWKSWGWPPFYYGMAVLYPYLNYKPVVKQGVLVGHSAATGTPAPLNSASTRLILAANGTVEEKTVHPWTVLPAP